MPTSDVFVFLSDEGCVRTMQVMWFGAMAKTNKQATKQTNKQKTRAEFLNVYENQWDH